MPPLGLLLRSLAFDLWLYGSMAVMGIVLAPAAALSRSAAYWAMRVYCAQALWMLRRICGLRVAIRGPVPTGAVLIAAKHQSFLDVIILMRTLPRPKFVMKRSLIYAPILGLYALRIGAAPIQRARGASAIRSMRRRIGAQAAEAGQTVIYPQGTRVAPETPVEDAPYRRGIGALYRDAGVPCTPVATNAGLFWGRNSLMRRPGLAVVSFLPEIPAGLPTKDFMARIETEIETAAAALIAEGAP